MHLEDTSIISVLILVQIEFLKHPRDVYTISSDACYHILSCACILMNNVLLIHALYLQNQILFILFAKTKVTIIARKELEKLYQWIDIKSEVHTV